MKTVFLTVAAVLVLLGGLYLVIEPASAHRVNIFAWVEGDTIHVQSKFAGGKRVKAAKIVVLDPQGNELLSGMTNEQGEFSFPIPMQADLKIVLIAGQGHQAEWTLPAAEMKDLPLATDATTAVKAPGQTQKPTRISELSAGIRQQSPRPVVSLQEVEAVIESVLDRKLKPIYKMLAEASYRGPTVGDIMAGIGYILGLVGIAAYVHSRKKKEKPSPMLQEPFAVGNSILHRIDPRIRIAAASIYSVIIALSRHFPALATAVGASLALIMLAKLRPREVVIRLMIVNGFTLLLWLVLPLTFQGPVAFRIGALNLYRPGLIMSAQITLKSNAILMVLMALIATMRLSTLGSALNRLHVPDKIVHLLLMAYRYIFVIEQEYQRLMRAARIRGFRPRTNLHTYKTYAYIVGMLFVRSALRADRVYKAMLCRGFKRKFYCLHQFSSGKEEWLFGTAMGVAVMVLIYLEWLKPGL